MPLVYTGLTTSDTSLNSLSDSNQNYSYGNQVLYQTREEINQKYRIDLATKIKKHQLVVSQLNGEISIEESNNNNDRPNDNPKEEVLQKTLNKEENKHNSSEINVVSPIKMNSTSKIGVVPDTTSTPLPDVVA